MISEYPPVTSPARYRFLARNRLVAGLSEAVVVVEAGWRSGARNTATWGRRLGRPVLAVPGPVTSAASTGCHRMIREGEARLVSSAADVVEEAGPIGVDGEGLGPARALDVLQGDGDRLRGTAGRRNVQHRELSEESGVTIERVRAVLPVLELDGFVGSDESGWFRRGDHRSIRPRASSRP